MNRNIQWLIETLRPLKPRNNFPTLGHRDPLEALYRCHHYSNNRMHCSQWEVRFEWCDDEYDIAIAEKSYQENIYRNTPRNCEKKTNGGIPLNYTDKRNIVTKKKKSNNWMFWNFPKVRNFTKVRNVIQAQEQAKCLITNFKLAHITSSSTSDKCTTDRTGTNCSKLSSYLSSHLSSLNSSKAD